MDGSFRQDYLADVVSRFRAYQELAEKALAQVSDEEFFATIDSESNSIAIIVKHIAGNSISRWTNFLISDGEKPDRNRDSEFVIDAGATREQLMNYWTSGWQTLFAAIEPLTEANLKGTIRIRGEEHSVIQAINRQLAHYAYHIGQIVFLAKHFRSTEWKSLSVPRNRSQEFNEYLTNKLQASGSLEHSMAEGWKFGKK